MGVGGSGNSCLWRWGGLITKGGSGFSMWPAKRLERWDMDHGVPAMGLINGVKLMVLYLYASF